MFIQQFNKSFDEIATSVRDVCATKEDVTVNNDNISDMPTHIDDFSEWGFRSFGQKVGFPASFLTTLFKDNSVLAEKVVSDRLHNYFSNTNTFVARKFNNKVCGIVSDKYAYFDDDEVMDILENSSLKDLKFTNIITSPERLHLRAIDEAHPFKVGDDDSEMYLAYFIDNSMVGGSSFRVRLGTFRKACSNGLIIKNKDFVVCRQAHRGTRSIAETFNENIEFLVQKRDDIIQMLQDSATTNSAIKELSDEFQRDYLARKLNASNKEVDVVLEYYNLKYDGKTKYALTNAITEFAKGINDIDRREYVESLALTVS